jgi:hypothetical protein
MAAGMSTDPLQDAKQAAREQAGAVWNDTKETARSLLGEQQRAAAGGLGELATALRKAARDMDGAGNSTAADGLEHFSGTLRARDLNGLLHDVESFARRQPVAFVGAAVAVGFLAARFLKSSNAPDDTGTPF